MVCCKSSNQNVHLFGLPWDTSKAKCEIIGAIPILNVSVPKKASATVMWLKSGQMIETVLTCSSSILIDKFYFYIILSLFYNVAEKFNQFSWARN
jgi:hypothetical protein